MAGEKPEVAIRLGLDLGGTKIEIIALDKEHRELLRCRVKTPQADYQTILARMVDPGQKAERQLGEDCTIGIGTPGALSRATARRRSSDMKNAWPARWRMSSTFSTLM